MNVAIDGPDISVVLATYDRRATLPRAIASVLVQDDAHFELIIVDDASRDGTRDYLATLGDPRIRVIIAERNGGPSAARNLGLACTLSSAVRHDRRGAREARIPEARLAPAAFEWALLCDLIPVEATSITARRSAALAAGGFCERLRLTEDREFLIRLARHGGAALLPDLLWEKYWGDDNLSNDWGKAGPGLIAYLRERPEYPRKLGAYLATKVLMADLRLGQWGALLRDVRDFHAAGLIDANALRLIRDHREVRCYRRDMSSAAALARITGPPPTWR